MTRFRPHALRAVLVACTAVLAWAAAAVAGEPGSPVNRTPPELSQSGRVVTTTDGSWVGETEPFTYAWLRCATASVASCDPIAGEEEDSYTLQRKDIGDRIRSRVTASNEAGSTQKASEDIGPVRADLFPVEPGPGPEPEPEPDPELLRPKPVVVIAGLRRGRFTFVNELTVRGPRRALVRLRCRGRRCPVRRISTRIRRNGRIRLKRAERTYRAGLLLRIRVIDPRGERIGKFTGVRFRGRGRAPRRNDSCLRPGERRPSPCPAGGRTPPRPEQARSRPRR